ncbi:hypothetical protein [Rhizobium leguminosarum]|uniref:hypothetical protein n=1 Tax=Rhizobium leguminosarum TaxID=384 RepID=UPI0019818360|nr:hypothetical protein [Rhizobium leguminosarum]
MFAGPYTFICGRNGVAAESLFSRIRLQFNEIVEEAIDAKALLTVRVNQEGHLDFSAELLNDAGNATSDHGFSYKKLLCIAFDLAILRAHLPKRSPASRTLTAFLNRSRGEAVLYLDEIVCTLDDEGDDGRPFRMPPW